MMQVYFVIIGVACLIYYGIIRIYTGKWNSTFAGFWFFSAILHGVGVLSWPFLSSKIHLFVQIMFLMMWVFFLWIEGLIIYNMKQPPVEDAKYLIVLGAHVNGTVVTNSLKRRLDAAIQYLNEHPDSKVIVSGGRGEGESISEAEAMSEYLITYGIDGERVIKEERSTTTNENLKFSAEVIKEQFPEKNRELQKEKVLIVTNNFHVYRSLLIAKKIGYENAHGLSATSNEILEVNYLVREFFALIWMKLKTIKKK